MTCQSFCNQLKFSSFLRWLYLALFGKLKLLLFHPLCQNFGVITIPNAQLSGIIMPVQIEQGFRTFVTIKMDQTRPYANLQDLFSQLQLEPKERQFCCSTSKVFAQICQGKNEPQLFFVEHSEYSYSMRTAWKPCTPNYAYQSGIHPGNKPLLNIME